MVDWKFKGDGAKAESRDWSKVLFPPEPIAQSERLLLRPLHMNDAPQLAKCLNDPRILNQLTNRVPNPYSVSDAEWFINHVYDSAKGVHTHFCIVPLSQNALNHNLPVGIISLDPGPDVFSRTAEIGYWLATSETGKGYMTEATIMIIEWAFSLPNGLNGESLLRISSNIFGGNEASTAVARKTGFKREGVLRDAVWKNGELKDLLVLGLTRADWEEGRECS